MVDQKENIQKISPILRQKIGWEEGELINAPLSTILAEETIQAFRKFKKTKKKPANFKLSAKLLQEDLPTIELWCLAIGDSKGESYILYGTPITMYDWEVYDWEKEERIKELNCLYQVGEWLEVSKSEEEFFSELPRYLKPGMLVPEKAVVYILYQGKEYGAKPKSSKTLKQEIMATNQKHGEIVIGYDFEDIALLDEEKRLLGEISRMIRISLERKWYNQKLSVRKEEEDRLRKHIQELEEQIETKEQELSDRRTKLRAVTHYLEVSSREWEESIKVLKILFQATLDHVALIDLKRNVAYTNLDKFQKEGKCHQIFFNQDKPCPNCRLSMAINKKVPVITEVKYEDTYFQVQSVPIFNNNHEVLGVIEYYHDITKEKEIELNLHQTSKLAALGELVSGIGHEINNPNQFIKGNIDIVKQVFQDILPIIDEYAKTHPDLKVANLPYSFLREQIMVLVEDMARGSERIKNIVLSLKRFARRDEGLLLDTVDINNIINESAKLVHNQVHKSANLHLDFDPSLPTITGNSQKLEQVMVNLILNAGQAMPSEKKGDIWIKSVLQEGNLVIEVKDNGSGMNEHTMKHIFDPFFTTKRAKGGTGIGLAISFQFIKEHEGSIVVDSKIGVGTTFVIKIPVKNK